MKGDVFGAQGDFITSPEISQMFGEVRSFGVRGVNARMLNISAARWHLVSNRVASAWKALQNPVGGIWSRQRHAYGRHAASKYA